MEVQVKEYKMKKKVVIIFSMIVGLKIVYIYMLCLMHFLWQWYLMFLVSEWIIHPVNVKWILCARL